jgi:hypothetical protein
MFQQCPVPLAQTIRICGFPCSWLNNMLFWCCIIITTTNHIAIIITIIVYHHHQILEFLRGDPTVRTSQSTQSTCLQHYWDALLDETHGLGNLWSMRALRYLQLEISGVFDGECGIKALYTILYAISRYSTLLVDTLVFSASEQPIQLWVTLVVHIQTSSSLFTFECERSQFCHNSSADLLPH